ncbi:MAG TPA: Uma2 family endonuclease [Gemmataceae bacterium]|jgi:Uma2 family endonuclease|nr:Uma2 family endonuclease [Gemmataceae bacterium]
MATAALKRLRSRIGPDSAGVLMTAAEFDRAEFVAGSRYELINGVLVVSPIPLEAERDPNEELGYWLRTYRETHPEGKILDKTLPEHTVITGENRRRVDRILWIGLGRLPSPEDVPTILAEFVSEGKRSWHRDYVEKRDEYLALGVKEYWIFDCFKRTLTVYSKQGKRVKSRVATETDVFTTPLLPGFQLPLARLLALADEWQESISE